MTDPNTLTIPAQNQPGPVAQAPKELTNKARASDGVFLQKCTRTLQQLEDVNFRLNPRQAYYFRLCQAFLKNKDLEKCTPASIEAALVSCVADGLLPDGEQATIFPRRKGNEFVVDYQIMYRGMMLRAHRAFPNSDIQAELIYKDDTFKMSIGPNTLPLHEPGGGRGVLENIDGVWAWIVRPGLPIRWVYMPIGEVNRIRDAYALNAQSDSSPWKTEYQKMVKKTAVKQLIRELIPSILFAEETYAGPPQAS